MSDRDVDPAALRRDVERIKTAMGIAERYDTAPHQWLLFGIAVAFGCAIAQYVVLERLPMSVLVVVWLGLLIAVGSFAGYSASPFERSPPEKPNITLQILVPFVAVLPLAAVLLPFLGDLSYEATVSLSLAVLLVLLGVGHLLAANSLRAYHIRPRDRYAFAFGGVLLLVLSAAIANLDVLHTWGYAAFGVTQFAYSLASYGVLTGT